MTTDATAWLIEAEWSRMNHEAKVRYLHARRWHKSGSHWKHRPTGLMLPIGEAVRRQLREDLAARDRREGI
jgi:hypothetical protein